MVHVEFIQGSLAEKENLERKKSTVFEQSSTQTEELKKPWSACREYMPLPRPPFFTSSPSPPPSLTALRKQSSSTLIFFPPSEGGGSRALSPTRKPPDETSRQPQDVGAIGCPAEKTPLIQNLMAIGPCSKPIGMCKIDNSSKYLLRICYTRIS